ncbi:MAG: hypothetical protein VX252_01705 [Myxococcota bacterium]|nr:hypothetical protein [Myxococcota bacterium]
MVSNNAYDLRAIFFVAISFLIAFIVSFSLLVDQIDTQSSIKGLSWDKQPSLDIWFESDPPLVYESLTNAESFWHKTNRHPLFGYMGLAPVKIMGLLGVPEEIAVSFVLALGVGLLSGLFALTLLFTLGDRPLVWFMQALFFSSSSFIFWAGLCERFPMGGATIMATTAGAAYFSKQKKASLGVAVLLNIISLSVTISNWMFGVLLSLCFFKPRKVIQITAYTVVIAGLLWLGEGFFIKQFHSPVHMDSWNEKFLFNAYTGSVLQKMIVLLGHTIVIPEIHFYNFSGVKGMDTQTLLGVQHSSPGGTGALGLSLAVGWAFLLTAGALSWWKNTEKTAFDRFLSFSIVGQLGLHLFYGTELFLYGPHVAPLLLLVAARGLGDLQKPTLKLALLGLGVFIPLLALHNITRYTEARALYVERYEAKREQLNPDSTAEPSALRSTIPETPSA